MLIVTTDSNFINEKLYVLNVVMKEFLGLEWRHCLGKKSHYEIRVEGSQKCLVLPDVLFGRTGRDQLLPFKSPQYQDTKRIRSATKCDGAAEVHALPVIYGLVAGADPSALVQYDLTIDIFGSIFFMLTRIEEVNATRKDSHDRFHAAESFAYIGGFLQQPIVDQYLDLLVAEIEKKWPGLLDLRKEGKVTITCDVDHIFTFDTSLQQIARSFIADLRWGRKTPNPVRRAYTRLLQKYGRNSNDPYLQAIRYIMNVNEQHGNEVLFYFMAGCRRGPKDGTYSISDPSSRKLLQEIAGRGHKIGIHLSYDSYRTLEIAQREYDLVKQALVRSGIGDPLVECRQHYLRWDPLVTPLIQETLGLEVDSTIGFASCPGYRSGTSRTYTMYDLVARRSLKIKQRPLVMMEGSVLSSLYLALSGSDAQEIMMQFRRSGTAYPGGFTLLWHNSELVDASSKIMYEQLIARVTS